MRENVSSLDFLLQQPFCREMKLVYETPFTICKGVCSDSAKQSLNSEWLDYHHCFSVQLFLSKLTKTLYF